MTMPRGCVDSDGRATTSPRKRGAPSRRRPSRRRRLVGREDREGRRADAPGSVVLPGRGRPRSSSAEDDEGGRPAIGDRALASVGTLRRPFGARGPGPSPSSGLRAGRNGAPRFLRDRNPLGRQRDAPGGRRKLAPPDVLTSAPFGVPEAEHPEATLLPLGVGGGFRELLALPSMRATVLGRVGGRGARDAGPVDGVVCRLIDTVPRENRRRNFVGVWGSEQAVLPAPEVRRRPPNGGEGDAVDARHHPAYVAAAARDPPCPVGDQQTVAHNGGKAYERGGTSVLEVVVIAGASAGVVGRAVACAERGAHIGLPARGREGLEDAREEAERSGGPALVVPTDVSDVVAARPRTPRTRQGRETFKEIVPGMKPKEAIRMGRIREEAP